MERRRTAVTLEDVARAAGVSRATASRALLEDGPGSTPARARVRAVAEGMGFRPDPTARALAGGAGTRVVIAVLGESRAAIENCEYVGRALSAAASAADRHGVGVSLRWAPVHDRGLLPGLAAERGVHGVVLVNTTWPVLESMPADLRGRVVSIGIGGGDMPSVDVDSLAGSTAVLRHMCASGRRRVAMIQPPAWLPCARRLTLAYRHVMAGEGRPERLVAGGFDLDSGRRGAAEVMARWPDTDAIFAACDEVAFGAMATLRSLGVRVPGDVAVAGFDDVPAAALGPLSLTTASHPVERIYAAAVEALLGSPGAMAPRTLLPSELVLRESA
ncbi:LacI family DNA-binding transcriptional regulator [Pseudonocardia humida]|uniref:LacI family DNA-binding transcriptional regulator n=1 Tax=Pseudonocardia humida TaxID=2800819 RepID=A0ABT0ZSA9_9PSEU|nr:LacI family DNA-binding transcriptional regulator [Pseudonocardia humida]MCO1653604.1 LacI family DNA-binding transcriptional regulator [Pseudonocardia humida]